MVQTILEKSGVSVITRDMEYYQEKNRKRKGVFNTI